MSIKKIYNQIEEDKQNQVQDDSMEIKMPIDEFVQEHEDLIEILREGSREELLAEADKQEQELEEKKKEYVITDSEGDNSNENDTENN